MVRNDFNDANRIDIYIDENKNVVIFPISRYDGIYIYADGSESDNAYFTAYYPIELKYPYSNIELAEKIRYGIEQKDKHESYNPDKKPTIEEKYYGIKGFKNAVKGKKLISVGLDFIQGKYLTLALPCKRGCAYLSIQNTKLSDDADWIGFADETIRLINLDLNTLESYKKKKSQLNI